jgi:hypothetical protein
MVTGMGPLCKACKKCVTDQNQNNVEKLSGVSEWPAIVSNNQSGEVLQEVTGFQRMVLMVNPACIGFRDPVHQSGNV